MGYGDGRPNCHSQTETYSGKNLKNKNKKDIVD
jgi:hypothetical protein